MTIDPTKAVPQAPRSLRAGSKGAARAASAQAAGEPPPEPKADDDEDEDQDDDDDDDGPDSDRMGAHEPLRAAAEAACLAAHQAYKASMGSDSVALLMAADDASAAAREACLAAEGSSAKLRGADAPEQPATPAPAPPGAHAPVAPIARAIATAGGTSLTAQTQIAQRLTFADRLHALFGGATLDASEGLARAAKQDAADAVELRAKAVKAEKKAKARAVADADAALRAELASAVRANKYTRAELFDVGEANGAEILTPKGWIRDMAPAARAAMIASKQARSGTGSPPPVPDESPVHISAAVQDYCARRGITDPKKIAALAASMGADAPAQESA